MHTLLGFLITPPTMNLLDECHEVASRYHLEGATRRKSEDSSHGLESPKHFREQRYAEGQMLVLGTRLRIQET